MIDLLIVIISIVTWFLPEIYRGVKIDSKIFRLFRLFRVVKILKSVRDIRNVQLFRSLQIIVGTLMKSIPAVSSIVFLSAIFLCEHIMLID
jgi:hypothetical protein